jgi:hypothetical protein
MVTLGILPPYSLEDIKNAYHQKVLQAHPDRGGTPQAFESLETAYQQALAHVRLRTDRRTWIAAHVETYAAVQRLAVEIAKLGAEVGTDEIDWVRQSFGDFADLTQYIIAMRVPPEANVNELIPLLAREHTVLGRLKLLDLSGCEVDDATVFELRMLRSLVALDLSRTRITNRALGIVHWLPALQRLDVASTRVGWWAKSKSQRLLNRRVRQAGAVDVVFHPANIR